MVSVKWASILKPESAAILQQRDVSCAESQDAVNNVYVLITLMGM